MITLIKNHLKVLRAKKNWTQEELAKKVGISRQAVISIEKYKYTPSLELAFKLAKAFEVDINQVFDPEEEIE
ncbi:helix-turn-helix transcriptional regulator [Enterococcus alishanensis]